MGKGQTIRIHLVDGSPSGLLTAEILNWTGKILVCPRVQLSKLANRDELRRTGIYILAGTHPEHEDTEAIYIGEGDNVYKRLIQHEKDESKEFYTKVAVVVSTDQNITKSHARYLEHALLSAAKDSKRAIVVNKQATSPRPLPESETADMENFLDHLRMMLPVLGFSFVQPAPETQLLRAANRPASLTRTPGVGIKRPRATTSSPIFFIKRLKLVARAQQINDELVVFKDSTARETGAKSWTHYRALRDQLILSGKLVRRKLGELVFTEDVPFKSATAASAVVMAANNPGPLMWRLADGTTYRKWRERQLLKASQV